MTFQRSNAQNANRTTLPEKFYAKNYFYVFCFLSLLLVFEIKKLYQMNAITYQITIHSSLIDLLKNIDQNFGYTYQYNVKKDG